MSLLRFKYISYCLAASAGACWANSLKALFGGKTELELNGLGVIKDSAEILAKSVSTFPTRQMAIAIIGFIAVSQGLFFFTKGLASFICGDSYRPDGKRVGRIPGFIQCLIGIGLSAGGAYTALYSHAIMKYLFGI